MAEGAKVNPLKASADVEGYKARHQTCDGELLAHDDAVSFCPCLRVSSLLLSRLGGKSTADTKMTKGQRGGRGLREENAAA